VESSAADDCNRDLIDVIVTNSPRRAVGRLRSDAIALIEAEAIIANVLDTGIGMTDIRATCKRSNCKPNSGAIL
jgi:hypothetical protein